MSFPPRPPPMFRTPRPPTKPIRAACVLVMDGRGFALAELHPDGVGLPGGKSEPSDRDLLETAQRELFEETGVVLYSAASLCVYDAGDYACEAFLAISWDGSRNGAIWRTRWVEPTRLVLPGARFPTYCALVFAALASERVKGLKEVRCVT